MLSERLTDYTRPAPIDFAEWTCCKCNRHFPGGIDREAPVGVQKFWDESQGTYGLSGMICEQCMRAN